MTPRTALVAQLSDPHVVARGETVWGGFDTAAALSAAVETVLGLSRAPELVLVSGDLTNDGRPEAYDHLVELLAPLDGRLKVIPGNHDERDALVAAVPAGWLAGDGEVDGVVELAGGGLRLVCLDSSWPSKADGTLLPAQLTWLDQVLAASGATTIVALHHPPYEVGIAMMDAIPLATDASSALADVVRRHAHVALVTGGHVHRLVVTRFGGAVAVLAPSVANAVTLELTGAVDNTWTREPPGILLHDWHDGRGLVTHLRPVGDYPTAAF
ncbi:MAG: phosphodiesterase [Gaiellales bacterium]